MGLLQCYDEFWSCDFCADLCEFFPDGVFHAECGEGPSSAFSLLLDNIMGKESKDSKPEGTQGQDIKTRLQNALQGRKCLIWLDNVQHKDVMAGCCAAGFPGALLLTGVDCNIWDGLPGSQKVHISHDMFWAAEDDDRVDAGDKIASRVLASRAANDEHVTDYPPGCEVRVRNRVPIIPC